MPRYPLLGLPERATIAAHDHDRVRKLKVYEDFVALRARTREFIRDLTPVLEELYGEIRSPEAVNGTFSSEDIRLPSLLRSAAVVRALEFPVNVRACFETLLARTGLSPLPAI